MSPEVPAHDIAGILLRPVVDSDYPFLRALYRSTREAELAPTGWPDGEKQAFCDSQFALQALHDRQHYPGAAFLAIEGGGRAIGRLYLHATPGELRLMEITLAPAERNRGIGTALMAWICEWADREGRIVTLHVEANSPARRLHERHGFAEDGEEGLYVRMRRNPR